MHLLRQFERETLRVRRPGSYSKSCVVDHDKRERKVNSLGTSNVRTSLADTIATYGKVVGVAGGGAEAPRGRFGSAGRKPFRKGKDMSHNLLVKVQSYPSTRLSRRGEVLSSVKPAICAMLPFCSPARRAAGRRAELTNSVPRSVPIMDSKQKNPVRVGLVNPSSRVGPIFYQDEDGRFCSGHYDVPLCPCSLKGDAYKTAISPYRDFRTFTTERAKQGLPVCKEQYRTTAKYIVKKKRYQRYGLNRKEKRKNWFKDKVLKVIPDKFPAISKSKLSKIRHVWSVSPVKLPPSVLYRMIGEGSKSCKIRKTLSVPKFDVAHWQLREPFSGLSLHKRSWHRFIGTPRKRSSFDAFSGLRLAKGC